MRPNRAWWRVKVGCGAGLIACLFIHYLGDAPPPAIPRALSQLLVVAGGITTLWHAGILGKAEAGQLVTGGGLFRWVRHPMYSGDVVLYLGLALLAPGPATFGFLGLGWVALYRQSVVEDKFLAARYGEAFEVWRQRTWLL